jgi:hypothetical protein
MTKTKKITLKALKPGQVVRFAVSGNVDAYEALVIENVKVNSFPSSILELREGPYAGRKITTPRYNIRVLVGGNWVVGEKSDGTAYNGRLI